MKTEFVLKNVVHERTGQELLTLVKVTNMDDGRVHAEEPWCSILELDELFEACVAKWGSNWDLNKVKQAIEEAAII